MGAELDQLMVKVLASMKTWFIVKENLLGDGWSEPETFDPPTATFVRTAAVYEELFHRFELRILR